MDAVTLVFRLITLLIPIIQQLVKEIIDEPPLAGQPQRLYGTMEPSDVELLMRLRAKL